MSEQFGAAGTRMDAVIGENARRFEEKCAIHAQLGIVILEIGDVGLAQIYQGTAAGLRHLACELTVPLNLRVVRILAIGQLPVNRHGGQNHDGFVSLGRYG